MDEWWWMALGCRGWMRLDEVLLLLWRKPEFFFWPINHNVPTKGSDKIDTIPCRPECPWDSRRSRNRPASAPSATLWRLPTCGWVKTLYPFCSPQNSWDLWMFIPLKMVFINRYWSIPTLPTQEFPNQLISGATSRMDILTWTSQDPHCPSETGANSEDFIKNRSCSKMAIAMESGHL